MRSSGVDARWWWGQIAGQMLFTLATSAIIPLLIYALQEAKGESGAFKRLLEPVAFEMTEWWDVSVGVLGLAAVLISVDRIAKLAQYQRKRLKLFRDRVGQVFQRIAVGEADGPGILRVLGTNERYVMRLVTPGNGAEKATPSAFQHQTEHIISDKEPKNSEERATETFLVALTLGAAAMAGMGLTSLVYNGLSGSLKVQELILWGVVILVVDLFPLVLAGSQGWLGNPAALEQSALRCVTNWSVLSWDSDGDRGAGNPGHRQTIRLSDATGPSWWCYWPSAVMIMAVVILPVLVVWVRARVEPVPLRLAEVVTVMLCATGQAYFIVSFEQTRCDSFLALIDQYNLISASGGSSRSGTTVYKVLTRN